MHFFYRVTEAECWLAAQKTGFFVSPDLLVTGFIHASPQQQVLTTAGLYFAAAAEVLALEIDMALLQAAAVEVALVWRGEREATFAHIHGPIPVSAVRRVLKLQSNATGQFSFCPESAP
ncbi:DUF952 domain-containing protein [Hymenobacter glacieicola]|uniref:DUF952 domain-containing protein n=1 Tax=Hymenobacter glacieicola TaxID=1562124 RepID=A0ABQ1WWP7_9BACT|nr:DUF952 domain-containing protein [Hymenobacter glacieicola]GGG48501.1 hypothetical protein GCM10011378_25790 [Hymenobacter glacieicola]